MSRLNYSILNFAKSELINLFAKEQKSADIYHVKVFKDKNKIYFLYYYIIPNKNATKHVECSKLACFNKRTRYMYFQNNNQKPNLNNLKCKIRSNNKFKLEIY